jgi:P4 family phage/plasmid primase-like protien
MRIFAEHARKLFENDLSVMPVSGKQPVLMAWSDYCRTPPTDEVFSSWETKYGHLNIGLALGPASNITAVDIDTDDPELLKKIEEILPPSPVRKRGKKGYTSFYRYSGHRSEKFRLVPKGPPVFELLSDGCQTVIPPSLHPDTQLPYTYQTPDTLENFPASELPELPIDIMVQVRLTLTAACASSNGQDTGGRNDTLKKQAVAAILKNKDDLEIAGEIQAYDTANHRPPLFSDVNEPQMRGHSAQVNAVRFVQSIRRSIGEAPLGGTNQTAILPRDHRDVASLAEGYLTSRNLLRDGVYRLRYYQNDFYRYETDRYREIPRHEMRAHVIAYLQSREDLRSKVSKHKANEVLANLEGMTLIEGRTQLPAYLGNEVRTENQIIAMKNGLFDLSLYLAGEKSPLIPHTPDFFSLTCLPFGYDASAECPTYVKFLEQMLPDKEIQNFLQEWTGLNLVYDTSFQKFVIACGEGANGKSVYCIVLRSLLGIDNVSAVALEQFSPTRPFALSATVGKLANIVQEIGELEKTAEGVLKDFIGGDLMTFERKHQAPFQSKPTARCTFATNVLPRIKDRTNGIWRRLILVPFSIQILDEAKQDKNLVDSTWWEKSGELPGIFNWALAGLIRLKERGHFIEPRASIDAKADYRQESNPASTFLAEYLVSPIGRSVPSNALYRTYSAWMNNRGCQALGESQFCKEVKRAFPQADLTKHAQRQVDTTRSREWQNLGWIDDKPPLAQG